MKKEMSKWLKDGTTGAVTIATKDGYRRAVNNDKKVSESDRLLQNTVERYESAAKEISETERYLDDRNADHVAIYGRIKEKLEWVDRDLRDLTKASNENNKTIQESG